MERRGPVERPSGWSPADRVRQAARGLIIPALSIFTALVLGGLVIVFTDPATLKAYTYFFDAPGIALQLSWDNVSNAYTALFQSSLGNGLAISETVVSMTPLLLAGLAVALGFQAGLFNIGAEGQILAGSLLAAYAGFSLSDLPIVVHLPLALAAGFAGGAAWGFIPGFLKARTGAHEVITTIMLNFVALYLVDFFLTSSLYQRPGRTDPISKVVEGSAQLPPFVPGLRANWGILIALVAAAGVWWLLYRTVWGFEFRAVGASTSAATYAGMSVPRTYIVVMALCGGLAGLAGTANLLGIEHSLYPGSSAGYGFDAIAIALLARSSPLGVILASFLFGVLRAGAVGMQAATNTPVDIITVIQALIIAFIAAPALVKAIYRVRAGAGQQEIFTRGWGS